MGLIRAGGYGYPRERIVFLEREGMASLERELLLEREGMAFLERELLS